MTGISAQQPGGLGFDSRPCGAQSSPRISVLFLVSLRELPGQDMKEAQNSLTLQNKSSSHRLDNKPQIFGTKIMWIAGSRRRFIYGGPRFEFRHGDRSFNV